MFSTVIGHELPRRLLSRRLTGRSGNHAWIFHGEAHLGKRLLAEQFIQAVNCAEVEGFCGECNNCRQIERGSFPYLVSVESRWSTIPVQLLRDKVRMLSLMAPEGVTKFLLINDAANLNVKSANMLLKTIEEPPDNTMVILLTTRLQEMLETIRSRCQEIPFRRLPSAILSPLLNDDVKRKDDIIRVAAGRPGILHLLKNSHWENLPAMGEGASFSDLVQACWNDETMEAEDFQVDVTGLRFEKFEISRMELLILREKVVDKLLSILQTGDLWEAISAVTCLNHRISTCFKAAEQQLLQLLTDVSDRIDSTVRKELEKEGKAKIAEFKEEEIHGILQTSIERVKNLSLTNQIRDWERMMIRWLESLIRYGMCIFVEPLRAMQS
jgi:hypothetical protein